LTSTPVHRDLRVDQHDCGLVGLGRGADPLGRASTGELPQIARLKNGVGQGEANFSPILRRPSSQWTTQTIVAWAHSRIDVPWRPIQTGPSTGGTSWTAIPAPPLLRSESRAWANRISPDSDQAMKMRL
jgi:hypothetical protein